jgi:hypothetical protein
VREARALVDAFGAGVELKNTLDEKAVVEGREEAQAAAGRGETQDETNKNQGYLARWDQIDAGRDFLNFKPQLREMMRGANFEDMTEDEFSGFIDEAMQKRFKAGELTGDYGRTIAPQLLGLQAEMIAEHKDIQLQKIQDDQLSGAYQLAQNHYQVNKVMDYEQWALDTNTFADGENKTTQYLKGIFNTAIQNGDVTVIDNMPETYPNGEATPKHVPRHQDAIRAARAAAMNAGAKLQSDAEAADKAANDSSRFGIQMEIYRRGQQGLPVHEQIAQLEALTGTKFSDVTAAKNFADGQYGENEDRSPSFASIGMLYTRIHTGMATPDQLMVEVFEAANSGELGFGETAVDNMNAMIAKIEQYSSEGTSLRKTAVTTWRTSLNNRYNAATGGLLKGINPVMQRINIDANDKYNALVLGGANPTQAWQDVIAEFDPLVASLPDVEESELSSRRSQAEFTSTARLPADRIRNAVENPESIRDLEGIPRFSLELRLAELQANGELSDEEIEAFGSAYNSYYE